MQAKKEHKERKATKERKDSEAVTDFKQKRLVFHYGDDEKTVADKLYERDIVLNWEKNLVGNA